MCIKLQKSRGLSDKIRSNVKFSNSAFLTMKIYDTLKKWTAESYEAISETKTEY